MKSALRIAIVLLLLTAAVNSSSTGRASRNAIFAFVDVNVVPMDRERILDRQTVIVREGKIAEIGPAATVRLPAGAIRINGRDKFLMPGLADMHVHLESEHDLDVYLAHGITTLRNMSARAGHLKLRDEIRNETRLGPTLYVASPMLDGNPPVWPASRVILNAEQAETAVLEYKKAGYDFIKIYSLLSREAFDGIITAAKKHGMRVVGHVPSYTGITRILESGGVASLEHTHGYYEPLEMDSSPIKGRWDWRRVFHAIPIDDAKLPAFARKVAQSGAWTCPTLAFGRHSLPMPQCREAWNTPGLRELGESNRRKMVKALHDAGARLLLGTDSGFSVIRPGVSIHEELKLMTEAGLTPFEAIKAGTRDAHEFLGDLEQVGTVTVGKRADLLLLDSNPLANTSATEQIAGVMINARWMPKEKK